MTAAAFSGYARGDFPRASELSHEAGQGARMSPYPGAVLEMKLMFVEPDTLAVERSAAMRILDEVGADVWGYAWVHGVFAVMAAIFGNLTHAQQEAKSVDRAHASSTPDRIDPWERVNRRASRSAEISG